MLRPHFDGYSGLRWEIHFTRAPTDLWLVQGIIPPAHGSEDEKTWIEAGEATTVTRSPSESVNADYRGRSLSDYTTVLGISFDSMRGT